MSENKPLSDRFKSYVYSTHPVMLSASELFRYADEIAALEKRLAEAEQLLDEAKDGLDDYWVSMSPGFVERLHDFMRNKP